MKIKTQYVCQSCGHASPRWLGRCAGCDAWNSLVEERPGTVVNAATPTAEGSWAAVRDEFRDFSGENVSDRPDWVLLDAPESESKKTGQGYQRLATGISELDRVLGGGLVRDSFTLLGGDPGIGKSTLLLQMARGLRIAQPELKILYVSGEESVDQIRGRAHRLEVVGGKHVFLAAETQLEQVFATVKEIKPDVLIMDSLQTFSSGYLSAAPGSVSQVREVAARLMTLAKTAGLSVWLVGHVTKEGSIAGPKVVEHMVDTVLYFEGDGGQSYRLLRTVKNRFGSSRELGVFEMEGDGLREVTNPSSLFLSDRKGAVPGTAIGSSLEGSRPLLVELQALVCPSPLAMPRRTSVGMDGSRIALIGAILERHMKISLANQDLFFNVAGGLRLSEPACDLAAAASIWSSTKEHAFPNDWVFIGELGLTGEVRRVSQPDLRIEEAAKLGFKVAIVPESSIERCSKSSQPKGIHLIPIQRIAQLPQIVNFSAESVRQHSSSV